MMRSTTIRAALRHAPSSASRVTQRTSRRYASTVPADKPRSWRSGLLRWTAAGAIVYYYNTTNIFAGTAPLNAEPSLSTPPPQTLDSISAERRQRAAAAAAKVSEPPKSDAAALASSGALDEIPTTGNATAGVDAPAETGGMSPDELEQEAGQEGAFNPETGEINWDCPCLGGMAHGPCGEDFKAAFSCFVFSKEEPKGVDCIDKFKNMQDCFRQHPDIYGAELDSDDDEVDPALEADIAAADARAKDGKTDDQSARTRVISGTAESAGSQHAAASDRSPGTASNSVAASPSRPAKLASTSAAGDSPGGATSESDELVPKAAHDARS